MENIIQQIKDYLPLVLQALGGLVILATAVVRITKSKNDDVAVNSIANKFFKAVSYLPTIGINPRTQKLEEAYKELKVKAVNDLLDEALKK